MILALKTDSAITWLALIDDPKSGKVLAEDTWDSGRQLADQLLSHIEQLLAGAGQSRADLTGIVAYLGPGSFTSLRLGLATANALAWSRTLPIAGGIDKEWLGQALKSLSDTPTFVPILPHYGSEPNVTKPTS